MEYDGRDIIEALTAMHDDIKAILDILPLICIALSNISPTQSAALKRTLQNLSDPKRIQTTKAFSRLCDELVRTLETPGMNRLLSEIREPPQEQRGPEELRALLRLVDNAPPEKP